MMVFLSPEHAQVLAVALGAHLRQRRSNGRHVPVDLAALLDALVAYSGQERPKLGDLAAAADPQLMSYQDAAQQLGVSARSVRRMVASGRLASVAAGRRRLIPAAEVARFVEDGAA